MHRQLFILEQQLGTSTLNKIEEPFIQAQGIELYLKRDDLLHPIISGNKWRKLKYILEHALSLQCHTIISMGGAFSNHLHALAFAGHCLGIKTVGFIRGELPKVLNPSLLDMQAWGMQLRFISRTDYRQLRHYKQHNSLPDLSAGEYWLPEGGAMELALQGVAELAEELLDYDVWCVPCGTATTLSGLIANAPTDKRLIGFSALKGARFLYQDVQQLLSNKVCHNNKWFIQLGYHFGGFAKIKPELHVFMAQFEATHHIPLEPIYTGKMLYGLYDLLKKGYFKAGQRIVAVHTGGLQGNRGFASLKQSISSNKR